MQTVSERALVQRINRKLEPEFRALRKWSDRWRHASQIGPYYIKHYYSDVIDCYGLELTHLEEIGREMGVLTKDEQLAMD